MPDLPGPPLPAKVYDGEWIKYKRKVAVKTLKEDAMAAADFLTEANVMKKVRPQKAPPPSFSARLFLK